MEIPFFSVMHKNITIYFRILEVLRSDYTERERKRVQHDRERDF